MQYVQDKMIVKTEGQRGIRDQLCVARQSRTFDQGQTMNGVDWNRSLPRSAVKRSLT